MLPKAFPTETTGPNEIEKLQITLEATEVEEEQNQVSDAAAASSAANQSSSAAADDSKI